MQISHSNFGSFVATMASVLEDIERRQAAKLQQAGHQAAPAQDLHTPVARQALAQPIQATVASVRRAA